MCSDEAIENNAWVADAVADVDMVKDFWDAYISDRGFTDDDIDFKTCKDTPTIYYV